MTAPFSFLFQPSVPSKQNRVGSTASPNPTHEKGDEEDKDR
jgi:hypothetical protein